MTDFFSFPRATWPRQLINLSREVRTLTWLAFPVPKPIRDALSICERNSPIAMALIDAVATYTQTCARIAEAPRAALLLAPAQKAVQAALQQGLPCVPAGRGWPDGRRAERGKRRITRPGKNLAAISLHFLLCTLPGLLQLTWRDSALAAYPVRLQKLVGQLRERADEVFSHEERIAAQLQVSPSSLHELNHGGQIIVAILFSLGVRFEPCFDWT